MRSFRVILEAITDYQSLSNPSPAASPTLNARPLPDLHSPLDRVSNGRRQLPELSQEHLKLKLRLAPLLQVEEALIRKLTPAGSTETEATTLTQITNIPTRREVAINSQFAWKGLFGRMTGTRASVDRGAVDWDERDPDVSSHPITTPPRCGPRTYDVHRILDG